MKHGPISIWMLTPEQVANYVPGMDLGEPHRIEAPIKQTFRLSDTEIARRERAIQSRLNGKVVITKTLYKRHRNDYLTDREIAKMYGIETSTLTGYKSLWRKGKG